MTNNVMIGNRPVGTGSPTYLIVEIGPQHGATQFVGLRFDRQATRFIGDFSCGLSAVRKVGAVWPKGKVNYCVEPEIATDRPRLDPVAC